MRRRLLAAVSLSVLAAAPVLADQEVSTERTTAIQTADADGAGNADNITITSNGRVTLTTPGPAVVLNSNHNVTTATGSRISIANADGTGVNDAVGVELQGGNVGDYTQAGAISILDGYTAVDSGTDDRADRNGDGTEDPDGDPDGEFATGTGRVGVLVSGPGSLIGDMVMQAGSTITVAGQESFGILIEDTAGLDGDFSTAGSINVRGERTTAIALGGDITGNVRIGGSVQTNTPEGAGITIDGDIGGGLQITGTVSSTGFRVSNRLAEASMALLDAGEDDILSGPALRVSGDVANGIFLLGPSTAAAGSTITQRSSAPAVLIQPGASATGDLTIGQVILPEGVDADRTTPESRELPYGIVAEGTIATDGMYDGVDSTGFLIAGRDVGGTMRAVLVFGGISNAGTIGATAYDATATGVRIGQGGTSTGVTATTFENSGTISASGRIGYEADGFGAIDPLSGLAIEGNRGTARAYAVIIDSDAAVEELLNRGLIFAAIEGGGEGGAAITINTDTLQLIENTGTISMVVRNLLDGFGVGVAPIALDASTQTLGLTFRQTDSDTTDEFEPGVTGNLLFGSGDDVMDIQAGSVVGDIAFGDGADTLTLRNASFTGGITDTDGQLVIDAEGTALELTGRDSLSLTSARFGTGSTLDIAVSSDALAAAYLNASGEIRFEDDATLSVSLANLVGESRVVEIISAGTLTFEDEATALSDTQSPYLYTASLARSASDANTLVLTLNRRTAQEMGMNESQAAALNPALAAFDAVDELGAAIAALRTRTDFFQAYDQLLPEYAGSAIQFSLAANDAAQGALSTRLRNARLAPDNLAGVWAQEFGYFADRNTSSFGPGYRGQGVGLAVGLDRPVGPFYAVGVNLVGAASEIEEIEGFDEPMVALTGQIGGYAAIDLGGFDTSFALSLGYDNFEIERNILIGSFASTNTASWSGWHVATSAQMGRDVLIGNWVVRPEASLTYLSLFESGYSETASLVENQALALIVDDRESATLTGAATLSLARRFGSDVSWWAPSLRVGYRGEFIGDDATTSARFGETGEAFRLRAAELPGSGVLLGFGLSAGSNYSTFTFAYDADVRDQFIRHVARLVIRLTF